MRLEDLLGTRLLHRTTRRIGLTADGRTLYDSAVRILADLEQAQSEVMQGSARPRGALRLTATEAFGRRIVLPILAEFLGAWPELTTETSFTDRIVDIVAEGFDVAIRVGESAEASDLIRRVIVRSSAQLCASPAYLERDDIKSIHAVFASVAKQPRATRATLDCFVAALLARTIRSHVISV